jgi:hypothetical protein
MMSLRAPGLVLASLMLASLTLLVACDALKAKPAATPPADPSAVAAPPEQPPELPVRPASAVTAATIDWDSARRDLAARPLDERTGDFQVATGAEPPPVPVMLPGGDVAIAATAGGGVRFQPMADGYFVNVPGQAYNIIVNGTNRVAAAAVGEAATPRDAAYRFLATSTGAQVAFSKYGADYLVEFECNEVSGDGTCITEADALKIAQELNISGTR